MGDEENQEEPLPVTQAPQQSRSEPLPAPFDGLASGLYELLHKLSLSRLVIRLIGGATPARQVRVAAGYMLFTTGGLVAMWLISPGDRTLQVAFAVLAIYRWLEIFTYGLSIVFRLTDSGKQRLKDWVSIGLYAFSVSLIFAILDHSFATGDYGLEQATKHATTSSEFLYIAWTQMTTLGNNYELLSGGARWLAMLTSTSGVLLVAVLIAGAVNQAGQGDHASAA